MTAIKNDCSMECYTQQDISSISSYLLEISSAFLSPGICTNLGVNWSLNVMTLTYAATLEEEINSCKVATYTDKDF